VACKETIPPLYFSQGNMGGLFSGPQQAQQQTPRRSSTQSTLNRQTSYARPWYEDPTSAQYQQYEASRKKQLLEEQRKIQERKRVEQRCLIPVSSRPLHRTVLQFPIAANWDPMPSNSAFYLANVEQYTQEYNTVLHLFKKTTQKQFKIVQIERVQNPYLLGCYQLKKNEMQCWPGNNVEESRVFHGTKQSNVQSICENNFNWRLYGDSIGNRYGKGVSFSPISCYASHYSDKHASVKVMFLVRVLIAHSTNGDGNMIIPPVILNVYNRNRIQRYDTAQKENGHVIVKFCDSEYYPEYLIHYTGTPTVQRNARKYTYVYDDDPY
jgi:poly [ADP-ribose] polymerase 7/11/12/13